MPVPIMTTTPERKALRILAVSERVGLSRASIRRMVVAKKFPPPRKIGERVTVWDSSAIDAWLDQQFAPTEREHAARR